MEHNWTPPPENGNLWKCQRCGAVICYNGKDPISDPYYEIPRPTEAYQSGIHMVYNRYTSVLSSHARDCDENIVKQIMIENVPKSM